MHARWYLIQTKPSSEATAQANLERQGYCVYLPRIVEHRQRSAHAIERIVPLFPRYLFLHLSDGYQSLGPVRASRGVSDIVRFGSNFAIVPDRIVSDLQLRADPVSGLHRLLRPEGLVPGAAVRVVSGPFDGLDGVFEREAGVERIVVLLELLGRLTPIQVPARCVVRRQAA